MYKIVLRSPLGSLRGYTKKLLMKRKICNITHTVAKARRNGILVSASYKRDVFHRRPISLIEKYAI